MVLPSENGEKYERTKDKRTDRRIQERYTYKTMSLPFIVIDFLPFDPGATPS